MIKILDNMVKEIETEMPYHIDRWYQESLRVSTYTLDDIDEWYENINYLNLTPPQNIVLEIKFNRFLEPYISNILGKYVANKESVSKYVMGRNI
jgi:hypothetical protein